MNQFTKNAIDALDIFTKNYCLDCEQSKDEPVFRCNECEFAYNGHCLLKRQAKNMNGGKLPDGFGSMSR